MPMRPVSGNRHSMIINRLIIREFFRYFGMVLLLVVCVYLLIDFLEKIDEFIESGIGITRIIYFALLQLPAIIVLIMPAGVLLAVIFMFGFMNRYRELLALRSSGVSVYMLIRPVILCGLICSMLLFMVSELFIPFAQTKSNLIWSQEVKKRVQPDQALKDIWLKKKQAILNVDFFEPTKNTINGMTLNVLDDEANISYRLGAETAVYTDGAWLLTNGMEQRLNEQSRYDYRYFDEERFVMDFTPDDLRSVLKSSEEMNFWELMVLITAIEEDGYDARQYKVDLHGRFSLLASCFILCLIGAGLAVRCRLNPKMVQTVIEGIVVIFTMWLLRSLFMSLGYDGEVLPPFVAAWLVNVIFGILAVVLLVHAE